MTGRFAPFAAAALVLAAVAAGAAWDPPGWRVAPKAEPSAAGPAGLPVRWAVDAYRATVSRVDGDRCPSHPTCSAYAREAVTRYGAFLGTLLTAGRLVGEADEAAFAPRVFVNGRWKVYAPVEDDLAFLRGSLAP